MAARQPYVSWCTRAERDMLSKSEWKGRTMTLSHTPAHVTYIDWRELWLELFRILDMVLVIHKHALSRIVRVEHVAPPIWNNVVLVRPSVGIGGPYTVVVPLPSSQRDLLYSALEGCRTVVHNSEVRTTSNRLGSQAYVSRVVHACRDRLRCCRAIARYFGCISSR
jgi:hypothetical protein